MYDVTVYVVYKRVDGCMVLVLQGCVRVKVGQRFTEGVPVCMFVVVVRERRDSYGVSGDTENEGDMVRPA